MTDTLVYFDAADQVVPLANTYKNSAGVLTDPDAVMIAVTDPHQNTTSYTYTGSGSGSNVIIKDSTGKYHISLELFGTDPKPPAGLWSFTWVGTGASLANGISQVDVGSFRVLPVEEITGMQRWYCSKEELKSRLNISPTDTSDDYEIELAIQAVTDWITHYCGQHFYRIAEVRTYAPWDGVWDVPIDPCVSINSLRLDYDGDGIYEVEWTQDVDYQLLRFEKNYNVNDMGVQRPNNWIQVTMSNTGTPDGGQWLPFIWPFTRANRIQIDGIWGWPDIPPNITQAALIMAADLFKMKDAPWGVAGMGELGLVKAQTTPFIVELLRPYINHGKRTGV